MKKELRLFLSMLLIIYLNKGCSIRINDPLKEIDITKILMHLDWPNMARYDAQNKEVNLEKKKTVLSLWETLSLRAGLIKCLRCLTTKHTSIGV